MRGYIRQKNPGSWQIQVYIGEGPDGRPKRHYETVKGNKGAAQRRLTELLSSLDKGAYTPPVKLTVAEHLHKWLDGYVKIKCDQRTLGDYTSIVETHLIPILGHIQLKYLHTQAIQGYYGKKCETLATLTVYHHHRVLSQSLKWAVRQGYLGRNPCDMVSAPKPAKKTMRTLTPGEAETFFSANWNSQYYPVVYTAVCSGLRQAELLGLRWRDINLDILSISVNQVLYKRHGVCIFKEPKTKRSSRRVSIMPKLAIYLREYKAEREQLYRELGQELALDSLVFANTEGQPLDPSVLSHKTNKMVKLAQLQGVRFHDMRHTFASLMLLQGVNPKIVSEALGHASVAFTLDVYSHIIEGMQSEAMSLLDNVLPAGINGTAKNKAVQNSNAFLTPEVDITVAKR
jgi:integrase